MRALWEGEKERVHVLYQSPSSLTSIWQVHCGELASVLSTIEAHVQTCMIYMAHHKRLMKQHMYMLESEFMILTALLTPPWSDFSSRLLTCKSVPLQTTAKQVFVPIRHAQIIHTVLKEGLWVHSGVASTKGSCRGMQAATEVI